MGACPRAAGYLSVYFSILALRWQAGLVTNEMLGTDKKRMWAIGEASRGRRGGTHRRAVAAPCRGRQGSRRRGAVDAGISLGTWTGLSE